MPEIVERKTFGKSRKKPLEEIFELAVQKQHELLHGRKERIFKG
jgi:hypothetical protein